MSNDNSNDNNNSNNNNDNNVEVVNVLRPLIW